MSKRKQLARERLEIYLVNLLLAFSPIFQICGVTFLFAATLMITILPNLSIVILVVGMILLLPAYSYSATLYLARVGAWVGSLWETEK